MCRLATSDDLDLCKATLSKLHSLGIAYGLLRPESLLVVDDVPGSELPKRVLLNGLAGAYFTGDQALMDAEMAKLEAMLYVNIHARAMVQE